MCWFYYPGNERKDILPSFILFHWNVKLEIKLYHPRIWKLWTLKLTSLNGTTWDSSWQKNVVQLKFRILFRLLVLTEIWSQLLTNCTNHNKTFSQLHLIITIEPIWSQYCEMCWEVNCAQYCCKNVLLTILGCKLKQIKMCFWPSK